MAHEWLLRGSRGLCLCSYMGYSVQQGKVTVDLSRMAAVTLSPDRSTAVIQVRSDMVLRKVPILIRSVPATLMLDSAFRGCACGLSDAASNMHANVL